MEIGKRCFLKLLGIVCCTIIILIPYPANPENASNEDNSTLTQAAAANSTIDSITSKEQKLDKAPKPDKESTTLQSATASNVASMSPASTVPSSFMNLPTITNSIFTGAAVLNISIDVPPGRAGMAPNLNLTYTNLQKNGWVGVGWNMDMGSIQRATKFGVKDDNDFVAVLNGSASELVPRGDFGADYYGTKIEGAFSKYYKTPSGGWEVTSKNGTKYYYGTTQASRQDSGTSVFKWCLDKVQDANGNYMSISYTKDSGEIYLDRIEYTGHSSLSPTNYIKFYRELRNDAPNMYVPNFFVQTRYRLKTIEVNASGSIARAYKFIYSSSTGTTTQRSVLSAVELYGNDASVNLHDGDVTGNNKITVFSAGYDPGGSGLVVPDYSIPALQNTITGGYLNRNSADRYMKLGDFNGDGKTDYMWKPDWAWGSGWLIAYGTADGLTEPDYANPALPNKIAGGYNDSTSIDRNMKLGDFNGDGKTDYMWVPDNGDGRWLIAYGTANGLTEPNCAAPALPNTIQGIWDNRSSEDRYMKLGDFNGDGKTDYMWVPDNGDGRWLIAYGTANGLTEPDYANPAMPYTITGGYLNCSSVDKNMKLGDFNGDGKTDYMWVPDNGDGRWLIAYGTANGLTEPDYANPALPNTITGGYINRSSEYRYMKLGDFNGDGKTDYMWVPDNGDGRWLMAYSTGNGFDFANIINPALPNTTTGGYINRSSEDRYIMVGDFNGDGKTDYMWVPDNGDGRWLIAYATGAGFDLTNVSDPALPGTITGGYLNRSSVNKNMMMGDFNGDGKTDYMWVPDNGDGRWLIAHANLPDHLPDVLINIVNAIGGSYSIGYSPSTRYTNTLLPFPVQLVKSITSYDGNGNSATTSYNPPDAYYGGLYDIAERDFRGFSRVTQTNPDSTTVERTFLQDNIYKGLMSEQVIKDMAGNTYTDISNTYQYTSPYSGCFFPYLFSQINRFYDGTSDYKETGAYLIYDNYGNVTRKQKWGTGVDVRIEDFVYIYNTSKWIVSRPSHAYIRDGSEIIKAHTWYNYDPNGNLLTKTDWLDGGQSPVTSFEYDSYGNQTMITDPRGVQTIITYDAINTYPANVNTLGLTTSKTYDYRYGKLLTERDFNNRTTTYQYDVFGRPKRITNPNDYASAEGTMTFYYENFGQGTGNQRVSTHMTEQSGTANYFLKENYFDGFGRTIKNRNEGPDGKYIVTNTIYDVMGRVVYSSYPYFENMETQRFIAYTYDPMGRITQVINTADNTATQRDYLLGTTAIIDANGHKREEESDVYGRLVEVREYTGTNPAFSLYTTTRYRYDLLGNLWEVTDAAGNVTTMHYDTLSRKTSMSDPDMGSWAYQYDANGNLTYQRDGKNQVITFAYDGLNRLTQKHYPTGPDVAYIYDEPFSTNSLGRLTTVFDSYGMTRFYYDKLGRTTKTVKMVDGIEYTVETSYDALGRTKSITYPDAGREVVYYAYDNGGNLCYVGNINTDSCNQRTGVYAAYAQYNAVGQPETVTYGNDANTIFQYYPANNRLYSITTNSRGQGQQNLAYFYDNMGNIRHVEDLIDRSRSQDFTYDELDRLTQAQSTAYGTISYSYNQIGNMTYNSQVGSYSYPINHIRPHAVSQVGNRVYSYDGNGNMINKNGTTITYDYDNRPVSIGGNTFLYDYAGQRVKKNNAAYIGKLYECTGGTCTKYIFAGNQRIASKTGSAKYYYHGDHLGSSSVITNNTGAKVEEIYYYPFGSTRYNAGQVNAKHKYTGQEEDAEVGLYYYGARYYDPSIGRFISADTIVQAPGDPQTLNRYSYVRNNPILYTDPDGHLFWEVVAIAAVVGAVSSGDQSGWNPSDMLKGAVIGAVAGATGYGAGVWAFGAAGGGLEGVVASAIYGGTAGGAAGGGMSAMLYGGNIFEGIGQGAGFGSQAGLANGGMAAVGVPTAFAAAGGGYWSGLLQCGSSCGEEGALYAFAGSVMQSALTMSGSRDGQVKVPEQGTPEWDAMTTGKSDVYVVTPARSSLADIFWNLIGLVGDGNSHVWHTQDSEYIPAAGRYATLVQTNVPWPREGYLQNYNFFTNNCTTRLGQTMIWNPSQYNAYYNYPGNRYYWWMK